MSDEKVLAVLTDIRNWIRAASHDSVKKLLQTALPDEKSRLAYQMSDGSKTSEQIRIACKMSPNALVALGQRCTSMGLMELKDEKKRVRLFDLADFDLVSSSGQADVKAKQ
jgi:hypothetical protein